MKTQKQSSTKNQKQVSDVRKAKEPVGITNQPSEMQRQEKVVKDRVEGQTGYQKIKNRRAA